MNEGTENPPSCTSAECSLMRWALFILYAILVSIAWAPLYRVAREADTPFIANAEVLAWALIPLMIGAWWDAGVIRLPGRRQPVPEQDELPELESTVLYRLYAEDGELLYAGISRTPERRMRQHALDKTWWPEVVTTEIRAYRTREEAARAEHAAITRENPRYNIARYSLEAHLRSAAAQ